jgi:predicted N-formylglutamate amidohydrolase
MQIDALELQALAESGAERLRPAGKSPFLLICEHAGAEIPAPWGNLGLEEAYLATHFAYDPGTAALTRSLSERLDAKAVLARWSRIFLDYNRYPHQWDHMRPDLGGIPVPGNLAITPEDRRLRTALAAAPMEAAIDALSPGCRALVGVHSFTPVMAGDWRAVDIGLLWREDSPLVRLALQELQVRGAAAGLRIGENAPYDWRQATAFSLQHHGLDRGLPSLCLEVRNSVFSKIESCEVVTVLLAEVLAALQERRAEWDIRAG